MSSDTDATRKLLERVLAESILRLSRSQPSPVVRELSARSESIRAALLAYGTRRPAAGSPERDKALAQLVLALAEEVLGRVDTSVEALRRVLRGHTAEKLTDPVPPSAEVLKVCPACHSLQRAIHRACRQCGVDLFGVEPTTVVDARYAVVREIGRGTMGVVHVARDLNLDREVALKRVLAVDDPHAAGAFQREATVLASIRSDHVVRVYAFGTHEGSHFLAMEHVEGSSLEDIVRAHARADQHLPIARAVTIVQQIARGLQAVHDAGIVHRDIKPPNIVIEERTGRPVIVDFGLAFRGAEATADQPGAGTPHYMAPEQAAGTASLTPSADVYALGCVAYELLCGRTPFEASSIRELLAMHVHDAPRKPSLLRSGVANFEPVLLRAMAKRPDDRYASASDFADALEEALHEHTAPGATLPPPPPSTSQPGPETVPERTTLRVLVVDDDAVIRQFCARCVAAAFGGSNVEIVTASSGAEAVAAATAQMADLVLLDYSMPGTDGAETLAQLRALPHGSRARVVVVSAATATLPRWAFAALGVNDFVTKPVRIPPFLALLKELAAATGWHTALDAEVGS